MKINENANFSDRFYIEAPEDVEDIEKFDDAVTDMDLVTPESNWYDFDNTFIATVEQIRAMIEDYGFEPVVYENFDEQKGPHGRIYDVYSLAFDADPINECVCAGQACGTGTISDFVPEKMRGVKDIHEEDDKFVESKNKIKEAMTDTGEYKKGNTIYGSDLDNPIKTIDLAEKKNMITKTRIEESFKKVMETKEVPAENPNNYFYNSAEKNIEYSKVNPNNMKVNKKLPESEETKAMPRAIRESRALPGGMLNSEEKTAYEDFLRERHLKQDKVKAKEFGKNKLGLYDDECGENGWHNWDGTKIERKLNGKTIKENKK